MSTHATDCQQTTPPPSSLSLSTIWLCGDIHGDLRTLRRALKETTAKPHALLFVGDLDPPEPVGRWITSAVGPDIDWWFIHGNHETDNDTTCRNLFEAEGSERNLHNRVVNVAGLRVAGLGGVFRKPVWYPAATANYRNYAAFRDALLASTELDDAHRQTMLREHRSSMFVDDYDHLANNLADVLLTHEAPSCHPNGFEAIDLLGQVMGVRWLAHGHHHDSLDYTAWRNRLGFTVFGVGLRGITAMDGTVIVRGERDAERARVRSAVPVPG